MKLGLTWGEAAKAVGGRVSGDPAARFDDFLIDSRAELRGKTFWALKGEKHDAHDFLADALARGASGWVIQAGKGPKEKRPPQVLEVADTLKALQALGAFHRKRFKVRVAAITGSNGKTTTKQMLASICSQAGATCSTRGNLNNHFGLPLSLLELGAEHKFGVFELGASHAGEIAELTALASPDAGVLTNISAAHIEFFGSLETVFETKAALALGIRGPVALNADDPWLKRLLPELGSRAVTFGAGAGVRVRLDETGLRVKDGRQTFALALDGRRLEVSLPALGRISRMNAAAAAAGALALGLGPEEIAPGLSSFEPAPLRMELRSHASGAALLVDAYNANPESMREGLNAFVEAYPKEDKYAVLGEMKELGAQSAELHRQVGEFVRGLPLKGVFLAGAGMEPAAAALKDTGRLLGFEKDAADLAARVRAALAPGRAFFFKASRAVGLEKLAAAL